MALFRKRKAPTSRRALRKAHTRQLKAQAAAEKKFRTKQDRAEAKASARKARKARKAGDGQLEKGGAVTTADPNATDTSKLSAATADREVSTKDIKKANKARNKARTSTVRNYLGVAKLLTPLLAPLAYRGATQVRGQLEAARARKLGVDVAQLSDFTGHGAALSARIDGIERALGELVAVHPDDSGFRDETTTRLAELSTAVHAAERMPTSRRRSAHHAVSLDLDRVDADLLARLKVR